MVEIIAVLIAMAIFCIIIKLTSEESSYMSFKASNDLVGLPIITFYSNKTKLHFLLDTGADKSAFSKDHLDLVENKLLDAKGIVTDAGGHSSVVRRALIRLYYDHKVFDDVFQLMDMNPITQAIDLQVKGQRVDIMGVIGSDFLTKYKYVVDFNKMVAYSKK